MKTTQKVRKILANYESDNPGTKGNLARILMPVSYTHLRAHETR